MRVAIIVQRYGQDVVGGAELLARQYAERFVSCLGWQVDVFTTTAQDYTTWHNYYPAGEEILHGVRVKRYLVDWPRLHLLQAAYGRLLFALNKRVTQNGLAKAIIYYLAWPWYYFQGPVSFGLLRALRRDRSLYDRFYFFTYLYLPTLAGFARVPADKAVLVATAHDEPPFYLPTTQRLLRRVPAIFANLFPEQQLLWDHMPQDRHERVHLVGAGFDAAPTNGTRLVTDPYILYLGRLSRGKGVDTLVDYFMQYKQRYPGRLRLVLAGLKDSQITLPVSEDLVYLGFVSDEEKQRLLRHAEVLVNPSRYESLSLIVVEAMECSIPVMVNRDCPVLDYYCKETTTAFGFDDADGFCHILAEIMRSNWHEDAALRERLAASRQWVHTHFSWEAIMSKIKRI